MGLAERVTGEGEDHPPDLLHSLPVEAPLRRAAEEPLAVVRQPSLLVLAREHLPKVVGRGRVEAGHGDDHLRDVLLVDHDPERLGQDLVHQRVEGLVGAPTKPAHVLADVFVRGGADDRGVHDEPLEVSRAALDLELAHGGGLDIEDAERVAPRQQPLRVGVVQGAEPLEGDLRAAAGSDGRAGVADHGEGAVPQQVDLHEAELLRLVLLPLDHIHPLGRRLHGNVAIDGVRRQHHSAAVDRKVAREPLQLARGAEDRRPGLGQMDVLEDRMRPDKLLRVLARGIPGDLLADAADLGVGQPVHLGDLAHRRARLEAVMVGDHRYCG